MNRLNIGIAEDRDIQAAYYQEIIRKELSRHELHLKHYRSTQECLADQEFLAEADIFLIDISAGWLQRDRTGQTAHAGPSADQDHLHQRLCPLCAGSI